MNETSPKDTSKAKKRDRSVSEKNLLKAAEDIFSKHGFKAATTRMIAKKAGVNESLIGRYFEGKMGLLLAIIQRYVEAEPSHVNLPYPPQDSLHEELLKFAKFKFDQDCKRDFDFFKIVLSQAIVDAKFNKRIREIIPMFQQPQLEVRLKSLQEQGKILADIDIKHLIKGLHIFMFGNIISQRVLMGVSQEEAFQTLVDFISRYTRTLAPAE